MNKLQTKLLLLAGLGALALVPGASARPWNQKTVLTFSGPVEIPGQILPAGTYVFRLADTTSSRHIVQVFNQKEDHVFGTFLAIPDLRLRPAEQTIIKFEERAAGSPQAIKAWFYPGETYGHEFVYPKKEAVELAKANNTPVPAMPAELSINTSGLYLLLSKPEIMALQTAPLKAEEPSGEEVELAAAFEAPDSQASAPQAELPQRLPSTASMLPLIGLAGLLALGTAATLRLLAAGSK